jgi:hypothetical protein
MKSHTLTISFMLLYFLSPQSNLWGGENSLEDMLKGIDAFQALEFANEWKWSKEEIESSVYPKTIVFKLPNGRIKKIPLPEDQMVVAVAPYINETHK